MEHNKRILFVDDEQRILDGIRRMLHPMRDKWEMVFICGVDKALELLAVQPFDVVVSDIRMPRMTGVEFLTQVRTLYPQICRIVLSGQVDKEDVLRCVGPIHQFLSKPCDAATLKSTLTHVCELDRLLSNPQLIHVVSEIECLPSLPTLYDQLLADLQSPGSSIEAIGKTIRQDVGMSAKILQLVNSAFFGVNRRICDPQEAVKMLGLETVKSIVITMHVFSRFEDRSGNGFNCQRLLQDSLQIGCCAKKIAQSVGADTKNVEDSFISGLLCDVGILILATRLSDQHKIARQTAAEQHKPLTETETQSFGTTHAQVGAYLLGLWGFSDPVVTAVAYHHRPGDSPQNSFCPLAAVHAAEALIHHDTQDNAPLNLDFLLRCGLSDQVPKWQEIYNAMSNMKTNDV